MTAQIIPFFRPHTRRTVLSATPFPAQDNEPVDRPGNPEVTTAEPPAPPVFQVEPTGRTTQPYDPAYRPRRYAHWIILALMAIAALITFVPAEWLA